LTWAAISSQANANVGDGDRRNLVRYISPAFWGFTFSASWGEDDFWDTALRYANEWNGVRFAAGIGYQKWMDGDATARLPTFLGSSSSASVSTGSNGDRGCADLNFISSTRGSDVDCDAVGMSASIMHVPTGLFLAAAGGWLNDRNRRELFEVQTFGEVDDADGRDQFWYIQAGIERNWFGLGKTTLYGEYFQGDTGAALSSGNVRNVGGLFETQASTNFFGFRTSYANNFFVTSSEVNVWGVGLVQAIDAAAMDLYIGYRNYSGDLDGRFVERQTQSFTDLFGNTLFTNTTTTASNKVKFDLEDFHAVFAGGIIRF
jgi:hypothetical protein